MEGRTARNEGGQWRVADKFEFVGVEVEVKFRPIFVAMVAAFVAPVVVHEGEGIGLPDDSFKAMGQVEGVAQFMGGGLDEFAVGAGSK